MYQYRRYLTVIALCFCIDIPAANVQIVERERSMRLSAEASSQAAQQQVAELRVQIDQLSGPGGYITRIRELETQLHEVSSTCLH